MLMQHLQTCIERIVEGTYMFGDVQTTLCLREAGVHYNVEALEFETLMMNFPPGLVDPDRLRPLEGLAVQWPQQQPCARVFAIHHLLPEQMQIVFDAEAAAPGRRPTYAELWRRMRAPLGPAATESNLELEGVMTTGWELNVTDTANVTECRELCFEKERCVQWTHRLDTATCTMQQTFDKIHVPPKHALLTSGAMLDRFHCSDREHMNIGIFEHLTSGMTFTQLNRDRLSLRNQSRHQAQKL